MNALKNYLSQKVTIDFKYVFKGGFWILFGHAFTILSTLITSYFFANYLTPEIYGNYRYLISAAVIISLFSLTGLGTATLQAAAKNTVGFFAYAVKTSLKYGIVTSLVAFVIAFYYLANDNSTLAWGLAIIGVFQPLVNSSNLIHSYFNGRQQFNVSANWHIFRTFLTTAVIVAATIFTDSAIVILFAFLLSHLAANLLTNFLHRDELRVQAEPSNVVFQKILVYAKHTSLQNIIIGIANQLDKILIFQTLGARELATYAFATAIPDQYKGVTKSIDTLLLPRFSKYNLKIIKNSIWGKTIIYFLALSLGTLVYILIAPFIFKILYPVYADSVFLSQIYSLGVIFGFGSIPFTAMKAEMDNSILYQFKLTLAVVQILLLVVLLFSFGLIGAIISRIIYRAFVCLYSYFLFYRMKI